MTFSSGQPGAARVLGRDVPLHQLDTLLALGTERIVCIAPGVSDDILALQREAERAGLDFHLVGNARGLAALITAADDVLVLAEGLLADAEQIRDTLGERAGLTVVPAQIGHDHGFERIDADRAFAGVLRVRGHVIERLHDVPADADVTSVLLRVALQSAVPIVPLPTSLVADGVWRQVRTSGEADAYEAALVRRHGPLASWSSPSRAIGQRLADRWRRALLPSSWALAAGGVAMASAALAWFAFPSAALLLFTACPILLSAFDRHRTVLALGPRGGDTGGKGVPLMTAAVLLALVVALSDPPALWFPALMAGGLLIAHGRAHSTRLWRLALGDVGCWALALGLVAAAVPLASAVQAAALVLLAAMLVTAGRQDNGDLTMPG